MIPFYSDITKDHIMRTDHIVEHYLGSYENINPNHKENIIDIFTDLGKSVNFTLH